MQNKPNYGQKDLFTTDIIWHSQLEKKKGVLGLKNERPRTFFQWVTIKIQAKTVRLLEMIMIINSGGKKS